MTRNEDRDRGRVVLMVRELVSVSKGLHCPGCPSVDQQDPGTRIAVLPSVYYPQSYLKR